EVLADKGRHGERGRGPGLPVLEQVAKALVRLLGRAEAGELAHRPEPAAVHRRVGPAGERIDPGIAEVALVVEADVVWCVERLGLDPGDRREELALPLRLRAVELVAPLLGRRRLLRLGTRVLGRGHARIVGPRKFSPDSHRAATVARTRADYISTHVRSASAVPEAKAQVEV